ncbi:MAG: hypothetical protein EAZ57_09905 [Cytophagales bacterium]|nr:MAG: hypothetical protein EAZ67_10565 [Cytophagales bacterium]TAF59756.1 MAG: hypothetical protein EAZ57_09905 [Cytophagales bacterium]
MNQTLLVNKILSYQFPKGFADRLCKEQNWTADFTNLCLQEYLKFMCLASIKPSAVPSKAIDEVWHLHLIYTKSYWADFLPNYTGKTIHHEPEEPNQTPKTGGRNAYQETLDSYQALFGAYPKAIWHYKKPIATKDTSAPVPQKSFIRQIAQRFWIVSVISLLALMNIQASESDVWFIIIFALLVIFVPILFTIFAMKKRASSQKPIQKPHGKHKSTSSDGSDYMVAGAIFMGTDGDFDSSNDSSSSEPSCSSNSSDSSCSSSSCSSCSSCSSS